MSANLAHRLRFLVAAIALALLTTASPSSAQSPWQEKANSAARLHLAVAAGGQIVAGVEVRLAEGWKTYWRSAGSTGLPPVLSIDGSDNVRSIDLVFPAPERFVAFGIEALGYSEHVTFPITVERRNLEEGARLSLTADLLVCGTVCVPERFTFDTLIPADPTFLPSVSDTPIWDALARVPLSAIDQDVVLSQLAAAGEDVVVTLKAFGERSTGLDGALIVAEMPDEDPLIGTLERAGGGLFKARLPVADPPAIGSLLRLTVVGDSEALDLSGTVTTAAAFKEGASTRPGLATIVLIAFLGGLILNAMPCVLPVLSLKLAALGRTAHLERRQQRLAFLFTAAGILAFVGLLAGVLGALKALGQDVFWGMQFQAPAFVAFIFVIFALMTLNLAGLFEVRLPSVVQNRLGRLGRTGDFADGFVIALIATPCSAPFLGTAISFGLAGGPRDLAIAFAALGTGFAFPYLAVALVPRAAFFLPRPGRWMLWLQRVLVLPMLAVLVWLGSILLGQAGVAALAATLTTAVLVAVAAALRSRTLGAMSAAVALAAVIFVTVGGPSTATGTAETAGQEHWQAFDRAAIDGHVADGHVVFVDVTADWCITCLYNKAAALDRDPVITALSRDDTIAMRADWTLPDDRIAAFVKAQGRYGIPLNVAFGPARPKGVLLPEILTVSSVLGAITEAQGDTVEPIAAIKE
ncbi:MAG: protein-disulfide reductase DsbD family protein [Acuticoccus sp.]